MPTSNHAQHATTTPFHVSRAFPNARRLASWGAVPRLTAMLQAQASLVAPSKGVLKPLCCALRGVAANDEICREAAEQGALAAAAAMLHKGARQCWWRATLAMAGLYVCLLCAMYNTAV